MEGIIKIQSGRVLCIGGSKSESNRVLLLKALFPALEVGNLSTSDDTVVLQEALSSSREEIDIHHAGTAMRFLTAFFAIAEGREVVLTGSARMQERPIGVLVEALRSLGACITYTNKEGYPPLHIVGKRIEKDSVRIRGDISSQFLSALLLIAPALDRGLSLEFEGGITSLPYLKMTTALLEHCWGKDSVCWEGNRIKVSSCIGKTLKNAYWEVESDWSSASYWYSFVALSEVGMKMQLSHYKQDSLQGDSILASIYEHFGVYTTFEGNGVIRIEKRALVCDSCLHLELNDTPDIAQTIAVTALGLGIELYLEGLHTLKIKETDRLIALQTELRKLGAEVSVTDRSLHLSSCRSLREGVSIATYNDHRMAMAFAPLMQKIPIEIEDKSVVSKSYPEFWEQLSMISI